MIKPMLSIFVIGVPELLLLLAVALVGLGLTVAGAIFVVRHLRRKRQLVAPPVLAQSPAASTMALKECPRCHGLCSPGAPEGLCPQCLAKAAFASDPAATQTPASPEPAQLAAQFPQLEILGLLGRGGMGMVYKARQPRLDRIVALKILPLQSSRDPYFAERFTREARALARLNHPGIVTLHDFGQTADYYYFIMEYVDGMNLRQLIQARTLEPRQALELVTQICTALQFAHDEKIVHRDIKPENILITKKGQVKIADFGLAKLLGTAPDTSLTQSQAFMGTFNYMAPEQRESSKDVDHRADIYSLGVVFYEMLTGEVPMGRFDAPSKKVHIDVRLDEVVLRALEREPARRYQQASEVRSGVETITSSMPAASPSKKTTPDASGPSVPQFFWLRAYGLFFAGWLGTKLLWNFRSPGCWLACLGMAALVVWVSLSRMRLFPEQLAIYSNNRPLRKYGAITTSFLALTFGFVCLIGGFFNFWERETPHANIMAPSAAQFEAQYKGKEYQLIRGLAAFSQNVPNVEMDNSSPWHFNGWVVGWWQHGPGIPFFDVALNLIVGCYIVSWFPFVLIGSWRVPGMKCFPFAWRHARTSLALGAVVVGSALPIYAFSELAYGYETTESKPFDCKMNIEAVTKAIQTWAGQNGYALGEDYNFDFNTVPKGTRVAEARLREAWKPSPFDRWRSTWTTFRGVTPHLGFKLVSGVEAVAADSTRPHWTSGFHVVGSTEPEETQVSVSGVPAQRIPENLISLLNNLQSAPGHAHGNQNTQPVKD